jgi:hypothetical protein
MKKLFLLTPMLLVASLALAQGPQKEVVCLGLDDPQGSGCTVADPDDVKELKLEVNKLIDQHEALLHQQQDWNNGNANQHINGLDQRITNFTNKRDNAANAEATAFWQAKLDEALAEKVLWEDTSVGSPRDEASKLGPQISALLQRINSLKQELRVIE